MAIPPMDALLRQLKQLAGEAEADRATDQQLLGRFVAEQDQHAFVTLMQRHGPMVLGVCRRFLGNSHDADDAFQATFVILVRRAGTLAWHESIGPWLYQVAHRVVRKAHAAAARRRAHVREVADLDPVSSAASPDEPAQQELRQRLHEELDRLPAKYRVPLILCYLQGKTHEEAAQELGWPRGSMARRLDRGQELLRDRLVARGATFTMGLAALLAAEQAALPAVPACLVHSTAALVDSTAPTALPAAVAGLVEGVLHAMLLSKLRLIAVCILVVTVIAGGLGLWWSASWAADAPPAAARNERGPEVNGTAIRPWVIWSGANSQVADAGYRRITSSAEWQNLWLAHTGQPTQEGSAIPQVDFQQGMVVAVFQGARFNCRGVQAVSVTETAEAITFRFVGQSYQTDGEEKATAVKPYGFFLLPRSGKSLVLEENVQARLGQPPEWKLRAQFDALVLGPPAKPETATQPADPNAPLVFEKDILPILLARCGMCHGVEKFKGKFDCRTHATVLKGGESGSGIVPGSPKKSEVWGMIDRMEMPPEGAPKLTAAEKAKILQWIEAGARSRVVAVDAEAIRGRIQQIAGAPGGDQSILRGKIQEACAGLLAKEPEAPRRFTSPNLKDANQLAKFNDAVVKVQMDMGLAMFKLDTHLEELEDLRAELAKEPKEWQARYCYVAARLAAQEAFLYEYNARLGQLRRSFPQIDPELHQGWQLVDSANMQDRDAAKCAKRAQAFLEQLARDHAGTSWAAIADAEKILPNGLEWKPWPREK